MRRSFALLLVAFALIGCGAESGPEAEPSPSPAPAPVDPTPTPSPAAVDLVDPTYPEGTAGEPGWEYVSTAEADLDVDGVPEAVLLVANVGLHRGEPMWDDGQAWTAYVEEPDGARTELYRRYVQLGDVALAVAEPAAKGGRPTVLLTETTPMGLRVLEIEYRGPGQTGATVAFERLLRSGPEPLRSPR